MPRGLLLTHPRIRVFDRPRTFVVRRDGLDLALSGFPFAPDARTSFPALLAATGHADAAADVRLLCLHQAVEGARVGPAGFAAVPSGHIHRSQALSRDLAGRPLASPVLFAGSTDRTSFAERNEPKGTFLIDLERMDRGGTAAWEFRQLPVRPMVDLELDPGDDAASFEHRLRAALSRLDPSALVRPRLPREPSPAVARLLGAEALRLAAPPTVTVSVAWRGASGPRGHDSVEMKSGLSVGRRGWQPAEDG